VGDQAVGLDRGPFRLRLMRDHHPSAVHLAHCAQARRRQAEALERARPVGLDPAHVVAARIAAVERREYAIAHPALAREEAVADAPGRAENVRAQHGRSVGRAKPGGAGASGAASTSTLNSSPMALASVRRNRAARNARCCSAVARSISFAVRRWMPSVVRKVPCGTGPYTLAPPDAAAPASA